MQIKITIEADDKISAYKAVNRLALVSAIKEVETADEIWVFESNENVKYLFNKEYRDTNGDKVIIK